jgi:ferredoxin
MKVEVDEHRCVGAGQCVWVAPRVFDQRPADGVVLLRAPHPDADDEPYVREAVALCPARAIRIVTDDAAGDPAVPDAGDDEGAPR